MYVCICNAITEKMLQENDYYYHLVGSKCGKCVEDTPQYTCGQITYLHEDKHKQPA
jgi:bacterioferritin-associated ferredoxin